MVVTWNPNVLAAQLSAQPVVHMGQSLKPETVEMERRRKGCRFGPRRKGRCPGRKR